MSFRELESLTVLLLLTFALGQEIGGNSHYATRAAMLLMAVSLGREIYRRKRKKGDADGDRH